MFNNTYNPADEPIVRVTVDDVIAELQAGRIVEIGGSYGEDHIIAYDPNREDGYCFAVVDTSLEKRKIRWFKLENCNFTRCGVHCRELR